MTAEGPSQEGLTIRRQARIISACNPASTFLRAAITARSTLASPQRVWQHREERLDGFTKRYGVKTLVHYEPHATMESAILREKQLKHWNRAWKIRLIERGNPDWRDLYPEIAI
jgi:putative endonuclease